MEHDVAFYGRGKDIWIEIWKTGRSQIKLSAKGYAENFGFSSLWNEKNPEKFKKKFNIIELRMPFSEFTSIRKLKFSMFKKLSIKGDVNE